MKSSIIIVVLFAVLETIHGGKKMIHPAVNICKRNDPNISDCYCKNVMKMIPIIKNGLPEMNIPPIDPIIVEKITLDFTQTKSVNLVADLFDVKLTGISSVDVKVCDLKIVDSGVEAIFEINFPVIKMHSDYKAKGKFLLLDINTKGNFDGEFKELYVKTKWTSSKFMKKGKEHLKFDNEIIDMTMKDIKIHFNKLFGDQTELNDNINESVNENIDVLYNEIKPVILETLKSITLDLVNNMYKVFPYDVLFPEN